MTVGTSKVRMVTNRMSSIMFKSILERLFAYKLKDVFDGCIKLFDKLLLFFNRTVYTSNACVDVVEVV